MPGHALMRMFYRLAFYLFPPLKVRMEMTFYDYLTETYCWYLILVPLIFVPYNFGSHNRKKKK